LEMEFMQKDETLDAKGLMCPMPIVKLSKRMKEIPVGTVLELISDDIGSKEDIPAWCKRTGNDLMGTSDEGGAYYYYIKKLV
jgi:tRNA 2-thiouridine synthesizing protein A